MPGQTDLLEIFIIDAAIVFHVGSLSFSDLIIFDLFI